MKCELCGLETSSNKGLAKHLKARHKMLAKDYYDKYLRPPNVGICSCGKPTQFLNLQKGYQKHCCARCAQLDPNVQNKFRTANPQKDEDIKQKTVETCIERYDGKGYGSNYIQTKAKITRFNNKHKEENYMNVAKQVDFSIKPLGKTDQYYGFSLEDDPMYIMPDGTVFHNSGKSVN